MKFTDGLWLTKEGVEIYSPAEVLDQKIEDDKLIMTLPHTKILNRGQTLAGPVLTAEISSPAPDIIRVKTCHYKGQIKKGPSYEIIKSKVNPIIEDSEDSVTFKSGNTSAVINKKEWSMDFYYKDRPLTGTSRKNLAYITTDEGPYFREQLGLQVGECVYGLGERFTPFVKNGQVVDIWNKDGGTSSEQAYKNVPFYITNKGYGVFVNHPECVSYEVASEVVSRAQFSVPGEELEYFIIGGATLKTVLKNYTSLTGKPALPPAWSFGLWLTTSFTTSYDEETVNSFIDGMAERDLPLHVFHFDCFWMKEYEWCNFEWDERVFPDPEAMLTRLKARGLKICVWINPYIGQKSRLFDEGMEKGYLLKKANGDVWQWDLWQPGMGIVDFTNPQACEWYAGYLKELLDMGVDSFKTDFGERIPLDVVYHDGSDPKKMHNYYSYLFNKVVFELLEQERGSGEAVLFARSGTAGSQKFPVHWGGDCISSYESMAESLRGGLSLCLSGFGFWSHDISGFESTASPDVYKRWVAFGLMSTHSRLHGNNSYRVPWLFDEEAVDVLRYFTKLKCRLMPYIFSKAVEASNEGIPAMRAMVLEFPDDPGCNYLDLQYMLGDSILVAPVFSEAGDVSYYLPKGVWTNFITGDKIEGGGWIHEEHDFMSLPLMVKPNSIIPVGPIDDKAEYDFAKNAVFHVFELSDGQETSATIFSSKGESNISLNAKRDDKTITLTLKGEESGNSILLRNVFALESVQNGSYEKHELGMTITPEGIDSPTIVSL
ncbi:MAG TPA: alpha-xylosidase [Bacillota bacterium]|nr:alpha-xylosidase [Bacillota bacterium]